MPNDRAWHLQPGQAVDLGVVHLRQDRAVQVRVAGVWAPGQREPWWLATDLPAPLVVHASWVLMEAEGL